MNRNEGCIRRSWINDHRYSSSESCVNWWLRGFGRIIQVPGWAGLVPHAASATISSTHSAPRLRRWRPMPAVVCHDQNPTSISAFRLSSCRSHDSSFRKPTTFANMGSSRSCDCSPKEHGWPRSGVVQLLLTLCQQGVGRVLSSPLKESWLDLAPPEEYEAPT